LVWGVNFTVISIGLEDLPPLLFSALRFTVATLPWVFFVGRPEAGWRLILAVGVSLGLLKFTALFIGIAIGLPAGLASLTLQSQVFFTVLFAAVAFGERPAVRHLVGMVIAFTGIGLIALDLGAVGVMSGGLWGLALCVLAAAFWGVANLFMKRAATGNMLNLIVWVSLVPPVPLFAASLAVDGPETVRTALAGLDWVSVGAVLYISYGATLLGFGLWGRLLGRYPAGVVAPFSMLVPVFGMSTAALVLGEPLGPMRLIAAALILLGLATVVVSPEAVRARFRSRRAATTS
jgi:O-acetylserine/cysteine efflux transporter